MIPVEIQALETNLLRIDKIDGFCTTWCIYITRQMIKIINEPNWIVTLNSIDTNTKLTQIYREILLYIIIDKSHFFAEMQGQVDPRWASKT